jgi:hypothetical protein
LFFFLRGRGGVIDQAIKTISTNWLLSVVLLLGAAPSVAENNSTVIHFGCGMKQGNEVFQNIHKAMTAVLADMGYEFQMSHLPRNRVEAELDSGRIDGICGKTRYYYENSPVALPVLPPVSLGRLILFGRHDSPDINTSDVHLLYVRGSSSMRDYLDEAGLSAKAGLSIQQITTIYQGLRMVAANRADYLVEFAGPGMSALKELGLEEQINP